MARNAADFGQIIKFSQITKLLKLGRWKLTGTVRDGGQTRHRLAQRVMRYAAGVENTGPGKERPAVQQLVNQPVIP